MSQPDIPAAALGTHDRTDPELISCVREGDVEAYGILFSRHVEAATRLARLLISASDADDLVSEAFVKVLNVLLAGRGPDVAFRAYLLTAVRRLHIDKVRSNQRLTTTDDLTPFDPGVPFTDTAVAGFEGGAAARAFASLPERWQLVLWHLEVENQKPADIAPLLGMTPNSVSALAYRAREGLRQAFLNMHAGDLVSDDCRETSDLLGGYVRGALSRRDSTRVEGHLEHCRRCTAVYLELSEVNSSLAALLGPAVLGAAAAGYLGGGAATSFGAGVLVLVGKGKEVVVANMSVAAATAGVVAIAGIAAIAVVNRGPAADPASAEPPVSARELPGSTSSTPPTDGTGPGRTGSAQSSTAPTAPTGSSSPNAPTPSTTTTPSATLSDPADVLAGLTGTGPTTGGDQAGDPGIGNGNGSGSGSGNGTGTGSGSGSGSGSGNGSPGTGPVPTAPGGPEPFTPPTTPATPDPTQPPDPTEPPDPAPTDPAPTDPGPTTDPGPSRSADLSVRAWVGPDRLHRVGVLVRVSGVPSGERAQLRATGSGSFHVHGGRCQRADGGYTCAATPGWRYFYFHVVTTSAARITFSVAAPDGYTDPSPGNNTTTVVVRPDPDGQRGDNPSAASDRQQQRADAGRQPGRLPAR